MKRSILFLLLIASAATSGCGSKMIFRSDFNGVSNGPFSSGNTGSYSDYSTPNGDEVVGSNLEPQTAHFVNSAYQGDGLALELGPNPPTELASPVIEYRPVTASSNHDERTFFWQGRKAGSLSMDCTFLNYTSATSSIPIHTLRFANGEVKYIVHYPSSPPLALDVGTLANGTTHNVWVEIEDAIDGGTIRVSPHGGGTPIERTGVYVRTDYQPGDVRVSCSYSGLGNVNSENYQFDKMVFRSK